MRHRIKNMKDVQNAQFKTHRNHNVKKCKVCKGGTQFNKPYCIKHVRYSPYIKNVLNFLSKRDEEIKLVEEKGKEAINLDTSIVIREILEILESSEKYFRQFAHNLEITTAIFKLYIEYLIEKNIVYKDDDNKKLKLVRPVFFDTFINLN